MGDVGRRGRRPVVPPVRPTTPGTPAGDTLRNPGAEDPFENRVTNPSMATVNAVADDFQAVDRAIGGRRGPQVQFGPVGPAVATVHEQPVAPPVTTQPEAHAPAGAPPPAAPPVEATAPPQIILHRLDRPAHRDPRLIMAREPDGERAAAFRVLRHRLAEHKGVHSICVTSPTPGGGATTLAMNLAMALAELGRARVALVEANLRRPAFARILDFVPPACFADQLAAHRARPDDPWVLVEALAPTLHVGAVSPQIADQPLLDAAPISRVTAQLRAAGYEHVIIDAAPILGSADVNMILEGVDGVLVAAGAGRTRARELRNAKEQLGDGKLLGVVLVDA